MKQQDILIRQAGKVGIIELARPDKFNALTKDMLAKLVEALDHFEAAGPEVRAVLLCAQGKQFCTGADLLEAQSLFGDSRGLDAYLHFINAALVRLESSPLPVVCAVQGLALAGGLELILCCDVVFAADNSRLGDQHAQYGLVPAWGASQRLPWQIGRKRALDLMYSGRWIGARQAQDWGLVNYVTEPEGLQEAALAYCTTISTRSAPGIAAMKELVVEAGQLSLADGLALERSRVVEVMEGPDPYEGIKAFQEKRKPNF